MAKLTLRYDQKIDQVKTYSQDIDQVKAYSQRILGDYTWDLSMVGGLRIWLDAATTYVNTTDTPTDGTLVSSWVSRWGSTDIRVIQATTTIQPTWRASGINSLPSIEFDGTADYLEYTVADFLSSGDVTVFVMYRPKGTSAAGTLISTADTATDTLYWDAVGLTTTPSTQSLEYRIDSDSAALAEIHGGVAVTTGVDYCGVWASDGSATILRLNNAALTEVVRTGADAGDAWGDVTGRDNWVVGALKRTTVSQYFNGWISEIAVYDRLLADFEIHRVEKAWQSKYGYTT